MEKNKNKLHFAMSDNSYSRTQDAIMCKKLLKLIEQDNCFDIDYLSEINTRGVHATSKNNYALFRFWLLKNFEFGRLSENGGSVLYDVLSKKYGKDKLSKCDNCAKKYFKDFLEKFSSINIFELTYDYCTMMANIYLEYFIYRKNIKYSTYILSEFETLIYNKLKNDKSEAFKHTNLTSRKYYILNFKSEDTSFNYIYLKYQTEKNDETIINKIIQYKIFDFILKRCSVSKHKEYLPECLDIIRKYIPDCDLYVRAYSLANHTRNAYLAIFERATSSEYNALCDELEQNVKLADLIIDSIESHCSDIFDQSIFHCLFISDTATADYDLSRLSKIICRYINENKLNEKRFIFLIKYISVFQENAFVIAKKLFYPYLDKKYQALIIEKLLN